MPDTTYVEIARMDSKTRRRTTREARDTLATGPRDLVAGACFEAVQYRNHVAIFESDDHVVVWRLQRQPVTRPAKQPRSANIIWHVGRAGDVLPSWPSRASVGRGRNRRAACDPTGIARTCFCK